MINILDLPQAIALSRNTNFISISTDQHDSAQGIASYDINFSSAGALNAESFILTWLSNSVTITVATTPDNTGLQIPVGSGLTQDYCTAVFNVLSNSPTINGYFAVTKPTNESIKLTLLDRFNAATVLTSTNTITGVAIVNNSATGAHLQPNLTLGCTVFDAINNARIVDLYSNVDNNGRGIFSLQNIIETLPTLPNYPSLLPLGATPLVHVLPISSARYYLTLYERYGTNPIARLGNRTDVSTMLYGASANYRYAYPFKDFLGSTVLHGYWHPLSGAQHHIIATERSPHFISFIPKVDTTWTVTAKVFYTDGTDATFNVSDSPIALTINEPVMISSGWLQSSLDQQNHGIKSQYAFAINIIPASDSAEPIVVKYTLNPYPSDWERHMLYVNGLGGIDTLVCSGQTEEGYDIQAGTFESAPFYNTTGRLGYSAIFNAVGRGTIRIRTGYLPTDYIQAIKQLLFDRCWLIDYSLEELIPLQPTTSEVLLLDGDSIYGLSALDIQFTYANSEPGGNIFS